MATPSRSGIEQDRHICKSALTPSPRIPFPVFVPYILFDLGPTQVQGDLRIVSVCELPKKSYGVNAVLQSEARGLIAGVGFLDRRQPAPPRQ